MGALSGLGRLYAPDPRDKNYRLARAPQAKGVEERYWHTFGHLDQGNTSQCVAYAGERYLTTGPVCNKPLDKFALYKDCQRNDEWPGEDYEGTSVRALFKALKQRGYLGEYRWAFDAETVISHVLGIGPVVMGTVWTGGMANPTSKGFITPDGGGEDEGHAWCIIGASRRKQAARGINSWGDKWSPHKDRFWLKFEHLDYLIKARGEAGVASELRLVA